ncbi:MAG: CoF synthetase, partial [Alphaproteobacteria bacterium]
MQRWRDYVKDAFPRHDPDTLKMDKATLMGDFSAYNLERLTAEEVRQKLSEGYVHHDIACGASTGTSGNRGFYVITDAERYKWLGIILAKALPEIWRVQHRVAIILPQNSALYQTGNQTPRLKVQFHDLTNGPEVWGPSLLEFDPTVIVAPPKVLRWL